MKKSYWAADVSMLAGYEWGALALFSGLWSLFCFAGGPDGKFGSSEAIVAGLVSLAFCALFGTVSAALFKAVSVCENESMSKFNARVLFASPGLLATPILVIILLSQFG